MQKQLYILPLLLFLLTACNRDNTPYGDNPSAGKYYRIRGINMYCETYGQGKPLLLIHGNGGSISTFSRNIAYFAQNYKVIVADSRGQGNSADPRDSLTFEQMADDYSALLDTLHASPTYVFGWSDGGIIGLMLAMRHPEKVSKLATSGANLWPTPDAIESTEWHAQYAEYLKLLPVAHTTIGQKNRWKMLRLDMEQPNIQLNQLQRIQCPVFVIYGEHDIIRRQHTQLIYNNLLHADMWVVPHTDHYTISEHVNSFNERVRDFFDEPFDK